MSTGINIHILTNAYPVVESILSNLSATDASTFIHALDINLSEACRGKYMDITRDIPEHMDWIDNMRASGHVALLIGADLARWEWRIEHPDEYDRRSETPLCIWLAVVPVAEARANKIWAANRMYSKGCYYMHSSGAIHHFASRDRSLLRREKYRSTMFAVRHGDMEELMGDSGWHISTVANENNIRIVYFDTWNTGLCNLDAYVEPLHDVSYPYNADPKHAREGWGCYKKVTGCNPADGDWNIPLLRGPNASTVMTRGTSVGLRSQVIVDSSKTSDPSLSNALTISLGTGFPGMYTYYDNPDDGEFSHISCFKIPIADLRG